ncbi:MAG: hypothetical protein AAF441_21930, partial [Pseudomonadota bacterium]
MLGTIEEFLKKIYAAIAVIEGVFAAIFSPLWAWLRDIWGYIGPSRFSALTVLIGFVLLVFTPQGRELAYGVGDENPAIVFTLFWISVNWLALQSWYWARIALPIGRYSPQGAAAGSAPPISFWAGWVPRIYALIAYAAAAISLLLAGKTGPALLMIGNAAFALFGMYARRRLIEEGFFGRSPTFKHIAHVEPGQNTGDGYASLPPLSRAILVISVLVALVALAAVSIWPIGIGQTFGAAAIAFFAFGNLVPIGSYLVRSSQKAGFPIVFTLILVAVAFSPFNDNHHITLVDGDDGGTAQRLGTEQALDKWLAANNVADGDTVPLVLVSTAGGGIRAAYWTATVLGALQDACPAFTSRTFSISGVSGGSVGTAVFAANAANTKIDPAAACTSEWAPYLGKGEASTMSRGVLSKDFLGPTLAAMLFPDLVQRFLPYPFLPDRGRTLADSWAEAWAETCREQDRCTAGNGAADRLNQNFLSFAPWREDAWRPALLLNGTHEETGKRIITSHIRIDREVFFDAFDAIDVLQSDVALKTAALNSARFTYVSPAGLLVNKAGQNRGHVLDGGYFENYGAVTTSEILQKAAEVLAARNVKVRPILIQITSDPKLRVSDEPIPATGFLPADYVSTAKLANEVAGPIRGILATRAARGVLASKTNMEMTRFINDPAVDFPNIADPVFAHFELCSGPGQNEPPLGWSISKRTRAEITRILVRQ